MAKSSVDAVWIAVKSIQQRLPIIARAAQFVRFIYCEAPVAATEQDVKLAYDVLFRLF